MEGEDDKDKETFSRRDSLFGCLSSAKDLVLKCWAGATGVVPRARRVLELRAAVLQGKRKGEKLSAVPEEISPVCLLGYRPLFHKVSSLFQGFFFVSWY